MGNLCFINRVDGGDEWLAIQENTSFESISFGRVIALGRKSAAREIIDRIRQTNTERCRSFG